MNLTKPQQLIYDMEKFSGGAIAMICGSMISDGEKDVHILRNGVNEIYRINEALRIRVSEVDGNVYQNVTDYAEQEVEVLHFENKEALDAYARDYAKTPLDLYGNLCEIKIVVLPGQYGILAKIHHIVGDAWTLALLGTQFYDILDGNEIETYSYIDYVENEKAYLQSTRYEKDKVFFVEQFKKCDEVTYLNEKQSDTFKAERKTHILDSEQVKQIMDYAKQHDTSPFILFTAALSTYMNRVKMNAEKFYIGTAVLNRNGVKEKNTAGMFINTVPMLIELDNEKTFAQNLDEIQASAFSVLRHQKYNYGDVLTTIRKEYGFQEKLYDVMISYQNAKVFAEKSETTWYHSGEQSESLQIHIDDRDNEGIFRVHYDYLIEKFTEYEIDRLHEHICNLLFNAIENDTKKIYELDILSENETNKLLYEFNDTAVDYPKDKCVHQLFEEQVEKTPDKVAVIACDKTLTYDELNKLSNRIANNLVKRGVKANDIVAFALPRNSYLIAVMFGILKAGAAYLPIDPEYPQDRIEYMLSDSNAKLYISKDNLEDYLNPVQKGIAPENKYTSENSCYHLFTSGTTGQPKATTIKHCNLNNFGNVSDENIYMKTLVDSCNVVLALTTIVFDISVFEITVSLMNGLTLVLANEEEAVSPVKLASLINQYDVDAIHATPSKFSMYLDDPKFQQAVSRLKVLLIGGEVFGIDLLQKISQYTDATIYNGYGPTETTIGACFSRLYEAEMVHELFEKQVKKTPDKIAVVASDKTLTYAELNAEANRIAHSLIERSIGGGDIVAIKVTRKSYLFSAMLGVLKTSAAYMPIDPAYPEDRIKYMLTESRARYCIDEENIVELLSNVNDSNLNMVVNSEEIFCALHTSGSTGKPKMSLLTHQGIINFITANQRFWNDIDTVVSATIVTFDAFIMDSVLSVVQGKQVILASEDEIYNQTNFERLFNYSERNMLFSTPTKIEGYIENSLDKGFLSRIHNFVIGGETFGEHLLQLIETYAAGSNIFNIYGPTESTICTTVDELPSKREITIGRPIANTQIYIVDKFMQITPIGVTGELCIAGAGVGAGYLNRPELTEEKFVDNLFGEGKLYKTGDLAYWREDGNIAYVGRNDFQVKIRGLRIELGEIENAICGIEGITQSVVVVRKNDEGRQLICAFYTGVETDAKEIRNYIGKKLPKYMLPHICTHLEEMPLTSSGKINRKGLPEINLQNIVNENEYVGPENQQQKELCKLIEIVLGTSQVGITDDFFDLGGDSLKAIEFVTKAHSEGIYFNLQNVFDYPTVKALCECIAKGDKQENSFADVDFTEVNKILEKNTKEYIKTPARTGVGNILLSGATGYLGIHILADYLDNDTGTAYCLVRGKDVEDSTTRLQELLCFYFGEKYIDMNRIEVLCADLQKDKFGLGEIEYEKLLNKVGTVINCAASVKHYGSYKYFYEVNVETTKRLIEFCKIAKAKLIHSSTLSVSGNSFGDQFDGYISETEKYFYESSLYIEQPLENVYARSKFEAEKAVLDAMAEGLQANIMRMGNLTNRFTDGLFQKNHESNAFLQRIKSVLELGVVPDYLMELYAEFTPIDEAAKAIMTIARNFSTEQTVFHINSIKVVYMDKLLELFNLLGFNLKMVTGAEFTEALRQTAKQSGMEHIFETFINDLDENDKLNYDSNIRLKNDFTVQYLKMLGFEWSDIDIEYLRKYVEYFKKIEYLR